MDETINKISDDKVSQQPSKWKNVFKWILKVLWCIILWIIVFFVCAVCLWNRGLISLYIITLLSFFITTLLILFIKWYKSKNNKFKKWIIINACITLVLTWWWLTSAGIIPNWLWIEALYSCVDCNWQYFNTIMPPVYQPNWINCCAWTFTTMRDLYRCDNPWDPCIN